jgi:hypothetical protein
VSRDLGVECRPTPEGFECRVTVGTDAAATGHEVTVSRATLARLAPGDERPERLVEASFRFLLEREPRESILRRFDLPLISRYFPAYEADIRRRLEDGDGRSG